MANAVSLKDYIFTELDKAYRTYLVERGYWCPRCDCPAYPSLTPDSPCVGGDGWCPICGMNPFDQGPRRPSPTLTGILTLFPSQSSEEHKTQHPKGPGHGQTH